MGLKHCLQIFLSLCLMVTAASVHAQQSQKPNIVFIISDDHAYQAISAYGSTLASTPNIDRIAKEGAIFRNSFVTNSLCGPSRATLITGKYSHLNGYKANEGKFNVNQEVFPTFLQAAGYQTAYVGKWHLYGGSGPPLMKRPVPRDHQGRWHKWLGFEFRNSHFDSVYFEDDDPTPRPLEPYQTDGCFSVAMDYLRDRPQPEKPFCCVVSVEPPHPPYEAPAELEEKWLQRDLDLPPNFMVSSEQENSRINNVRQVSQDDREAVLRQRQIYYAMVKNMDQNVGRMNAFLKEQRLDESTIIVFLSDHGELGGAHGLRNKQLPYEESAGIPLIASGAGIPAGRVIDEPTCTEDFFPTLCGLAGISPRDNLPGEDLSPLIRGEKDHLNRDGVMLEFVMELRPTMQLFNQSWRAFRSQRYKYTVIGSNEGMQPWQFFDLEVDPYELNNLIDSAEHESLIRQHHEMLRNRMKETGDHAWLVGAFGTEPLNAWVPCHIGG